MALPSIIARCKSVCVVGPLLVAGLTLAAASDAGAGVIGWVGENLAYSCDTESLGVT